MELEFHWFFMFSDTTMYNITFIGRKTFSMITRTSSYCFASLSPQCVSLTVSDFGLYYRSVPVLPMSLNNKPQKKNFVLPRTSRSVICEIRHFHLDRMIKTRNRCFYQKCTRYSPASICVIIILPLHLQQVLQTISPTHFTTLRIVFLRFR